MSSTCILYGLVVLLLALVCVVLIAIGRIIYGIAHYYFVERRQFDEAAFISGLADMERELARTPLAEAKEKAMSVLNSTDAFDKFPASLEANSKTTQLAASQREFFSRFECVALRGDEARVAIAEIGPYQSDTSLIRLGDDGEHTHVVTKVGDDRVFIVADDVPVAQQVETELASIFHWILFVQRRGKLSEKCQRIQAHAKQAK